MNLHDRIRNSLTGLSAVGATETDVRSTGSPDLKKLLQLDHDLVDTELEKLGEHIYREFHRPLIDVQYAVKSVIRRLFPVPDTGESLYRLEEIERLRILMDTAIAKAYYCATLDEILTMTREANEPTHSPLKIHFDWLTKVVAHLKQTSKTCPRRDHTRCDFAHWLKSLPCELLLFSAGAERGERYARIDELHQQVHQQFDAVLGYAGRHEYILAYSNLTKLYQGVLQLDQQIRSLQLLYKEREETLYYSFIQETCKRSTNLYYFVSVEIQQILDLAVLTNHQHNRDTAAMKQQLMHILRGQGLDCIMLIREGHIGLFFRTDGGMSSSGIADFMRQRLHRLIEKHALEGGYRISSTGIGLELIKQYPDYLVTILKQLANYRINEPFTYVAESNVGELYDQAIESDRIYRLVSGALNNDRLSVFYQPIFSVREQSGYYAEALVRAPLETGHLEAGKFIHLLEREGRMAELDLMVLRHIHRDVAKLSASVSKVSVNIYPSSFSEPVIIESIISLSQELKRYDMILVLEITEQLFIQDAGQIEMLVNDHNIQFAMDDFGYGYSNLQQLIEYAERGLVNILKVDGSIVKKIEQDDLVFRILQIIIQIAATLDLDPVVMEYVYNDKVHEKLSTLSVPICYQGNYLSEPLSLDQLFQASSENRRPLNS